MRDKMTLGKRGHMEIQNVTNLFDIPVGLIIADKKQNFRTVMDAGTISELAQSIKNEGQQSPVRVQKRPDGKYDLIYGFRRYAAVVQLKQDTIRAEVSEAMESVDRKLANITENMAREDLTTYDQAVAFLDLHKAHDMSGARIAHSVGKSTQFVNNLLRVIEGVDDVILKRWAHECTPDFGRDKEGKKIPNIRKVCTMEWLTKLAANVPKDSQEYELRVALGEVDPDDGGEDDEGGDEGSDTTPRQVGSPKRASMKQLSAALEAIEEKFKEAKSEDKEFLSGARATLKYAIGKTQSIKDFYRNAKNG